MGTQANNLERLSLSDPVTTLLLWGIDISEKQIDKAKQHLTACGLSAKLICSPMEEECDIPADYLTLFIRFTP